ncbi:unnamed protein product [Sphagnum troendelagicum]|uniref:Peptidase A1 domain-containing protein n=1 Tax=Sphagnum jensenii TaxID=128206 RepID=A0ABP0W8M6_9BRYO
MESLPIRRAPGVLVLVVAIMLQASTQICLGRQIHSTGSGRPSDDETSTTQEVLKSYWIHRDHPDSPASAASTYNTSSQSERIAAAARRSLTRGEYFSRRVLDASSSGNFDSPVEAKVVGGEYAMAVSVGTPPRQFIVDVDTGSDLVWLNCEPCIQCIVNATDKPFDPTQSTSYQQASCTDAACTGFPYQPTSCGSTGACGYFYPYGEGIYYSYTSGILAYETFTFTAIDESSFAIRNVTFGCGQNESLTGFTVFDGFAGVGQGSFSLPSQLSLVYGFTDIFSYCLIPFDGTAANHSTFYFGVPETNISTYTPIYSNVVSPLRPYYYVNVTGISVGGVLLNIPADFFDISPTDGSGGVIFDSGTTYTLLIGVAYDAVLQEFKNQFNFPPYEVSGSPTVCFDVSGASSISIPNIVFHLQSVSGGEPVDFVLSLDNVLLPYSETVKCLTIMSLNPPGVMIIGNTAQANHEVVFDRVNRQIGWASTTCT